MKKILIILASVVVGSLLICGCTQEDTQAETNALSELGYSNSEHGIGINPPEGWTANEDDAYGIVRFTGPIVDDFATNFGITQAYPLGSDTLESISKAVIESYKTTFAQFTEISNSSATVNGRDAWIIECSYNLTGTEIYSKQVFVKKDGDVATISFAAAFSSYDTFLDEFDESLASFTMI